MKLKRLNLLKKFNPPDGMPTDSFESNGRQETDAGNPERKPTT